MSQGLLALTCCPHTVFFQAVKLLFLFLRAAWFWKKAILWTTLICNCLHQKWHWKMNNIQYAMYWLQNLCLVSACTELCVVHTNIAQWCGSNKTSQSCAQQSDNQLNYRSLLRSQEWNFIPGLKRVNLCKRWGEVTVSLGTGSQLGQCSAFRRLSTTVYGLTSVHPLQRVEEADQQVHEHSQVEGNIAPHWYVPRAPVQHRLGWGGKRHSKMLHISNEHMWVFGIQKGQCTSKKPDKKMVVVDKVCRNLSKNRQTHNLTCDRKLQFPCCWWKKKQMWGFSLIQPLLWLRGKIRLCVGTPSATWNTSVTECGCVSV